MSGLRIEKEYGMKQNLLRVGRGNGFFSVTMKSPILLLDTSEHIGAGNGDLFYLAASKRGMSLVVCEAVWLHSYDYILTGRKVKLSIGKGRRWVAGIGLHITNTGWHFGHMTYNRNGETYHA